MAQRVTQAGATRLTDGADVRVTEDDAGGPERISGREPLQFVEIHQDFCSRTYGSAPCTAVLPFEPFAFDFTGAVMPDGATLTRADAGYNGSYVDEDLVFQRAVEDEPRFTWDPATGLMAGLLNEPERTNGIRNSTMVGAVVGTPGTLPTNWTLTLRGLTADVVGLPIESGYQCIDIRYHGTASSGADLLIRAEAINLIAAAQDETWSVGFLARYIDQTLPPGSPMLAINGRNNGGTSQEASMVGITIDGSPLVHQRFSLVRTMTAPGTTRVSQQLALPLNNGQSYDFVLRMALPETEKIATGAEGRSTGIETTTAAQTRAADLLLLDVPDGTYDVRVVRAAGATELAAVSVVDSYTVPNSISPVRAVSLVPLVARPDATGTRKCYNTRATCQDAENYEPEDLALLFARPMAVLPKALQAIPSVASIETAPTRLNIGAGSRNAGPFGSRAVATVTFRDHPSPDRLVDKYPADRGFDPLTRGTFWTKWLARNPYYQNRRLVIRDGYVSQSLEEMVRRDYLLDRIEGPSPEGLVRVVAKDALKLAEDERAQAPRLSPGELTTAIDAAVATFSVSPATGLDYPESGTLRIGREVMTYAARSEADGVVTFSGVVRGAEGTTAASHDAEERAQLCLRYDATAVHDVLYDLLVVYGNVPAAFIDLVAWQQEAERWLQGFDLTALITEPTGVSSLVAEIIEQVPALIWWDERARLIKLRADRRDETAPPVIDERDHIVAGSAAVREDPAQRISQVWVYWRQRDPAQGQGSEGNFSRIAILADIEAEGADLYGESRIRKVFARWLSTDAQATVLARRLLQRFGTNPRFLTVSLDAKDRALWTADFVQAATRLVTDDTGAELTDLYQVISAEESVSGHTVTYDLQRAAFASGVLAGFYMADEAPNHDAASDEQKARGGWFAAEDGRLGDGSAGYVWQ